MHHKTIPYYTNLKKYIHSFNEFILDKTALTDFEDMIIPDALTDVWVTSGDDLFISFDNLNFKKLPKKIIWGILIKKCYLKSKGKTKILSIKIHPFAFNLFFNYPLPNLLNSYKNILDLLPKKEYEFYTKINLPVNSIQEIENYFIKKLRSKKVNAILFKTYYLIIESKGQINVSEIARKLNVSRQYLNTLFNKKIGLSIKQFESILKVRHCIDFYINEKPNSLTELSYQFNFFDQAHFINQFKLIVGEAPKTFFNKKILLKQYL